MHALDSKSEIMDRDIILKQGGQVITDGEVEWYSGSEAHTHPRRIRIDDVWEQVFQSDKKIEEDRKGQRSIVFRCHIGDNRIIDVLVAAPP
jgi:hypothetical protein